MDIKALADIASRLRPLKRGNINFDTEIMTAIVGPPLNWPISHLATVISR
jgi:hypothetical protein